MGALCAPCKSHKCCGWITKCGCGVCIAKCCGDTAPDLWHDKFTYTAYEQALWDNAEDQRKEHQKALEEATKYLHLRKDLKDGDVLAFNGETLVDDVIETFTGGEYGHVAIVCNCMWDEAVLGPYNGDVLIMESFSSHHGKPVPDALTGEVRSGTQAHILYKRLDAALVHDTVYAHALIDPLNETEMKDFHAFCARTHKDAAEYDYSQAYAIPLRTGCCATKDETTNEEDSEQYFCSEFVAAALRAAGRLPATTESSTMSPGDFFHANCQIDGGKPILKDRVRLVESGHPPLERLISDYNKDEEITSLQQQLSSLKQQLLGPESGDPSKQHWPREGLSTEPSGLSVEQWCSEAGQAYIGKTLGLLKEVFKAACPEGELDVDYPGGPQKRRAPAPRRLIVDATGSADDATVTRVWGYFSDAQTTLGSVVSDDLAEKPSDNCEAPHPLAP